MTEERRLVAIVVADVVGYSRLMAEDEEGTLSALRAHRNVTDPVILNRGGRIVKTMGDGLLLDFPSAVAALDASVEVQALMHARNKQLPQSRRMLYRIGINLGDVLVDETGDLFGDGVNIAARLESIAEPGGISVSNAVREAVRDKVQVGFVDDGDHDLKNIPRPVQVWKVSSLDDSCRTVTTAAVNRTVATVAVMPFENMSDDPEQEYFADGITEDLLTALSYDKDLAVIARNSTFAYKGTIRDIRTIARELDATHIVEGSVRKAGTRVRVTVQLVDAEAGHQLWAERFDREMVDIFDLQDDLVDRITARLHPTLFDTAAQRQVESAGKTVGAWDLTIRGQFHTNSNTIEGFLEGIELFDKAHRLEPRFAAPVGKAAIAWLSLALAGWRDDEVNPWTRFQASAETAYGLDRDNYDALGALAAARSYSGHTNDGADFAHRMIDINPHHAFGYHWLGHNLGFAGRRAEAIPVLTDAWRLGRYEPWRHHVATNLAYAHYFNRDYESATNWARESRRLADLLQAHIVLAAIAAQVGDDEQADHFASVVMETRPAFSCGKYRRRIPFVLPADQDHLINGLLEAGLPA